MRIQCQSQEVKFFNFFNNCVIDFGSWSYYNLPDMCLSLAFSIAPCFKLYVRLGSTVKLLSSLLYRSDELMSIVMLCTAILFGGYILNNFWFKVIETVICSTIK